MSTQPEHAVDLSKYAWLSIAAAIATIGLKASAWALTGSVGLLSDAAESLVNLAAGIVALIALKVAVAPPDARYTYGRSKAEYFSSATEGVMIFFAAGAILIMAALRFVQPQPLENVGIGLVIAVIAAVLNGVVGLVLLRAGRKYRSLALRADAQHLFTDVITSVGVVVGVGLVGITGIAQLDAVVAFGVGVNIVITGIKLVTESLQGLLDVTLPEAENAMIREILQRHSAADRAFHGLQTRISGRQRHMNVHVLVPGDWSVTQGHNYIDQLEFEIQSALPGIQIVTHLEPIEDPLSYRDIPTGHVPILPDEGGKEHMETPPGAPPA